MNEFIDEEEPNSLSHQSQQAQGGPAAAISNRLFRQNV
jgi:hypothetical protein